ncbi:PTS sugar transporter subunit IIC [Pseudocitrobacter corydidari]|uniref:Permease IIC component n=1 Tax=Pseudocitrobacter corydidari TaxID=2891570 RepID=A0ABY3S284_9ENTR|nr:PTS transporter subunit EIIC [Pseudocitrobacter corydidari]UGS40805.1 Lichenan permease IIC component [Pseudocitrobacter corydidari]
MQTSHGHLKKFETHMVTIATAIEQNRFISSIKNGMISLMAILMVGSISLIVAGLGSLFSSDSAMGVFFTTYGSLLQLPFTYTFGLLSVYCAITISYHHTQRINVTPLYPIISAVMVTIILNTKIIDGNINIAFLDSRGLFVAIFASLATVEFISWAYRKKITIRISGLPDMIAKTFESIFPLLFVVVIASLITATSQAFFHQQILPELFTTALAPAVSGIDSVWGVYIIIQMEMIFWFFGLNGYAILIGFTLPFMTQYLSLNAASFAQGLPTEHVFTEGWWGAFAACTGSGITGSIAILGLFSKSMQLKAAGKAAIVPSLFGISEPVVYGFPIAFNPYFFVPFVIGTPILASIIFLIFDFGFVNGPIAQVGGIPTPFAQYFMTMDWRAPILAILIILAGVVMYFPFFKMYERSLIKKDEELDQQNKKYDDLGLDF